MKYYTIFLGKKMWEHGIDCMNTTETWAIGGMVWTSKKKAQEYMENIRHPAYEIETKHRKFSIQELTRVPNKQL